MWPVLGGLITGGLGLIGNMFSSNTSAQNNAANVQMQMMTNQQNLEEAQRNRDFQQQMSNTAYQRSSADMTAAGLNPAAMFGGGSAASTPGGAQAMSIAPQNRENPGKPFENLGRVASDAIQASVTAKTVEKMTEEIAKVKADAEYIKALERTEEKRPMYVATQTADLTNRLPVGVLSGKEAAELVKLSRDHPTLFKYLQQAPYVSGAAAKSVGNVVDSVVPFASTAKSALKYLHEWKGPSSTGLSPSQTKNLYDKFEAMRGN